MALPIAANIGIDLFGQQPALGIYTQIALIHAMDGSSRVEKVTRILETGLAKLNASFPWTMGKVTCDESGEYSIQSMNTPPILVIKDYRDAQSVPSYMDMEAARFPFRMLDESLFAARNTIPGTSGESAYDEMPCFLVQASFIRGGLILTFNAQHQTMDVLGQAEVVRLFCKTCRGEPFTDHELKVGNMSRRGELSLPEHDSSQEPASKPQDQSDVPERPPYETVSSGPPPKCSWACFVFSPESLARLKQHATETKTDSIKFVSTDDALTAFVWQSVVRARSQRLDTRAICMTTRAIDVRKHFGLPENYTGMAQSLLCHSSTVESLVASTVGQVASQLRTAIDPKTSTIAEDTRAWLSRLKVAKDKSTVSFIPKLDLDRDIMLSSWAKVDFTELDFGLGLGGPVAVRRPQFIPVEGLGYLLPKTKDGENVLGICLKDEDLERLRSDGQFMEYAEDIP